MAGTVGVWSWSGVGELLLHELPSGSLELRVASLGRQLRLGLWRLPRLVLSLEKRHSLGGRVHFGDKLIS